MSVLEAPHALARQLVQQLTDDLGWLEEHARRHPERARHLGQLRLAAALARNCIGPYLDDTPSTPLHVAVVGGAGAGKSTITNFLTAANVAEANPQAGFTRHPIAYTTANGPLAWSQGVGFLGPLERLFSNKPSSHDADVYQVRRVTPVEAAGPLLERLVVWDCPDMTTWQATHYVSRLVEVVALADVVIYVASDERYNDEAPTQFLQLVLQAGKPVITCLMKMREHEAPALVDHFRREVVARLPECTRVAACLAVPHLTPQELADPVCHAGRYRQPLLDQLAWWLERPAETRKATVRGAMQFLEHAEDHLLAAAKDDLTALRSWRTLVLKGRQEFEARYFREYLSNEKFPRFNEALVRLLQLLELPGIGHYLSLALWGLRTPYRLLKEAVLKLTTVPNPAGIPEGPVLEAALKGWLDQLRKEAAQREESHQLWRHVEKGFHGRLPLDVDEQFRHCLGNFQRGLTTEVEITARAIYEDLEQRPALLNTLRGIKFTTEVVSIGGTLIAAGLSPWDLLIFLVTPIIQEITEFFGKQYVDTQRERARQRQQELLATTVAQPLADWLTAWPATGGSNFERLELALRRIPEDIQRMSHEVRQRLGASPA
jgi:hypothetical protein